MVEGGVDLEEAVNYDAEQLYEKLLKEKEQKQNGQEGNQNQQQGQQSQNSSGNTQSDCQQSKQQDSKQNGQSAGGMSDKEQAEQKESSKEHDEKESSNQDVGHDTHNMWEDAIKKHKEEQNESNKNKEEPKKEKSEIEKKQEEISKMGEKESFKKNREDKKRELEELKKSLSKQSLAGTTTNENQRIVTDIGSSKPLIDWRYVLREAIKYDVDWSYKNATIEDGVVSANLEEQPMPETEIVLDTSGSISEILLKNFLRECKNILQHSRVKVGCFDVRFYGFNEIRTEEDIEKMKFIGGGGTNFDAAVNAFSRRVENKIIFTDGDADMPRMPIDAIWIVFGGRKINPKGGKVINITGEQLDRLYSDVNNNYYHGRKR